MEQKKRLGDLGERFAVQLLMEKEYGILATNYRCKMGEIDIVAEKEGEIFFVEVKTRQSDRFGSPCESVTKEKQAHIRNAARFYLQENKKEQYDASFQVIEISVNQIKNAF